MKKLYLSAAVILLLLLISPAIMGQYIKYNITHKVPDKIWPSNIRIHVDSFKSGWFRSEATLTATQGVLNPSMTNQVKYPIQLTFYHGPFIWTQDLTGKKHWFFAIALAKGTFTILKLPFQLFSTMHVLGHSNVEFKLENTQAVENNLAINIGKMSSNNKLYDHWQRVVGDSSIENASFSMHGGSLVIPAIHASYNFLQIAKSLWLGHKEVLFPSLELRFSNVVFANAQNAQFIYDLSSDQKFVKFFLNFNLQKINYGDQLQQNWGPISFKLNAGPFAQDKFAALMEIIHDNQLTAIDNSPQQQSNLDTFLSVLPGATASLEVHAASQQGEMTFVSQLEIPANIKFNTKGTEQEIWESFSNQVKGNINVSIPNPVLTLILSKLNNTGQDPQIFLVQLEKAQAIRLQGNNWQTSIVYQNGHFSINGTPMEQVLQKLEAVSKPEESSTTTPPIENTNASTAGVSPTTKNVAPLVNTPIAPKTTPAS